MIDVAPTVLVWAGLLWAAAVAGWLVYRGDSSALWRLSGPAVPIVAYGVPIALIALGFMFAGLDTYTWWVVPVSCGVAALCELARWRFVRGPFRADERPPVAAALAVLVTAGVLLEFGSMLAVRLVIRPDPDDTLLSGLQVRPALDGLRALGVPLFGVAGLVLVAALVRPGGWLAAWLSEGSRRGAANWPYQHGWRSQRGLPWVAAGVLLLLFVLPAIGSGDKLTVAGLATPEYGKLLLLLALAVLATFDSFEVAAPRPMSMLRALGQRWVRHPALLFLVVAAASGVRHDFGTAVSALAATVGVAWSTVRFGMDRLPDRARRGVLATEWLRFGRTFKLFRPFSAFLVMLLLILGFVGFFLTDYVGERGTVWKDPWAYRWDSGCVLVDPTPSGPVAPGPQATSLAVRDVGAVSPAPSPSASPSGPAAPDDWVRCQRAKGADDESRRSQLSKALSAVADGGLWGRGLRDKSSSVVPAGSTDFVLVVIWHKLGAVAVLAAAALTVLLGVALPLAARMPGDRDDEDRSPTAAELFAAGLGTMIVGQFLFVLAATVNVIPHSGIPAPLLSRGGQSNLALLIGLVVVLSLAAAARRDAAGASGRQWGAAWSGPPRRSSGGPDWAKRGPVGQPGRYRGRPPGWLGAFLSMVVAVAIVAATTMLPYWAWRPVGGGLPGAYSESRPACAVRAGDRGGQVSVQPKARDCSTDRLAYRRTVIEIRFGDRRGLRQLRPDGTWQVLADPALGGLTGDDLAGLLRVGNGPVGTLERAYADTVYGSTGIRLADRLAPHHPDSDADLADGGLSLTIDPALQHALATTLRAEQPAGAGDPLPAGAVVLDVATGRVLAGVSAPPPPPPGKRDAAKDSETLAQFQKSYPRYGSVGQDGSLDGKTRDPSCAQRPSDDPCWRWSIQPQPQLLSEQGEAALRRYVGGDPALRLPDPSVDRAVGHGYSLGATVLLIVAGAYLAQPGHAATDRLATPPTLAVPPVYNPPSCHPDSDGRLTLAKALAQACATTFVGIAKQLSWTQVVDQARRFGLTASNCHQATAWLTSRVEGTAGTCVPGDATNVESAIAGAIAGRTDFSGTPLGVATMLAAVAGGGVRVQPTLVASATSPSTGLTLDAPPAQRNTALDQRVAQQVADALQQAAVDGSAAGLRDAVGRDVGVMAATVSAKNPAPDEFATRTVWLAGYVRTKRYGPVAVAVAVECRDEQAGAQRARSVLETLVRIGG
ncbi:FtsW/RodA/SpoVE family cell cycle protein [Dactylosporangium sp. NPDC051484]|uniref:FtsW/RodA/SpoVE family cell cycle protein n=1 Tax=Dactylosporangium sp. NPDC051484 TaxID=3154942 RepID=UPI00344E5BC8